MYFILYLHTNKWKCIYCTSNYRHHHDVTVPYHSFCFLIDPNRSKRTGNLHLCSFKNFAQQKLHKLQFYLKFFYSTTTHCRTVHSKQNCLYACNVSADCLCILCIVCKFFIFNCYEYRKNSNYQQGQISVK